MLDVLIYGTGTHAQLSYYYLDQSGQFDVIGFVLEEEYFQEGKELFALPVYSLDQAILSDLLTLAHYFVAIGGHRSNSARERIYKHIQSKNKSFVNTISIRANIADNVRLGENVFIDQGSMLHPFVLVEDNVNLISSKVGHHSIIKSHVQISGATLGGNVIIDNNVSIGMNSVVKDNTHIAEGTFIGMGCIIDHDTEPFSVYTSEKTTKKRNIDSRRMRF